MIGIVNNNIEEASAGKVLIKPKTLPKLLIGILLIVILIGLTLLAFLIYQRRPVPKDWITYSNTYYGYSVSYDPNQFFFQTVPYGANMGEDVSISINKINTSYLDRMKIKKESLQGDYSEHRGMLPDPNTVSWTLSFSKPVILSSEEFLLYTCKRVSTKTGAKYFSCPSGNYLPLTYPYTKSSLFVRIITEEVSSTPTKDDKKLIAEILRSINLEPDKINLAYPTKSQFERSVRSTMCATHAYSYNNFDTCENGLKAYDPYYIASSGKIIKTVNLTRSLSYCDLNISLFPNVANTDCPYPKSDDLYDVHSLGQCDNNPLCNKLLVKSDVYENSMLGKTTALTEAVKSLISPNGWKYYFSKWGNFAAAAPSTWKVVESEGGAQGKKFNTMQIVSPDKKLAFSINDADQIPLFRTDADVPSSSVRIGKFFCGRYASCELVRYKSSDPMFKVPVYEYGLRLLDEANVISLPKQIFVYIYDETTRDINTADRIVKTLLTLSPED